MFASASWQQLLSLKQSNKHAALNIENHFLSVSSAFWKDLRLLKMTNLVWEVPVFTELQPEMWDVDSKADETPVPEFTTYQEIQSEDWDVDDEVRNYL